MCDTKSKKFTVSCTVQLKYVPTTLEVPPLHPALDFKGVRSQWTWRKLRTNPNSRTFNGLNPNFIRREGLGEKQYVLGIFRKRRNRIIWISKGRLYRPLLALFVEKNRLNNNIIIVKPLNRFTCPLCEANGHFHFWEHISRRFPMAKRDGDTTLLTPQTRVLSARKINLTQYSLTGKNVWEVWRSWLWRRFQG